MFAFNPQVTTPEPIRVSFMFLGLAVVPILGISGYVKWALMARTPEIKMEILVMLLPLTAGAPGMYMLSTQWHSMPKRIYWVIFEILLLYITLDFWANRKRKSC